LLRGAKIDLRTANDALVGLKPIYERDARAGELSDEAIAAVNTTIRAMEGALGKTATAVAVRFAKRSDRTYFPLTAEPTKFESLLEQQLPGLREGRSDIADAFERHQPYQAGHEALGYLKQLYRENHHHDFTLQVVERSNFMGFEFGAFRVGLTDHPDDLAGTAVVLNEHTSVIKEPGMSQGQCVIRQTADWKFVNPPVSVGATLNRLFRLACATCQDISSVAGV
jgi:hypothetical protein